MSTFNVLNCYCRLESFPPCFSWWVAAIKICKWSFSFTKCLRPRMSHSQNFISNECPIHIPLVCPSAAGHCVYSAQPSS